MKDLLDIKLSAVENKIVSIEINVLEIEQNLQKEIINIKEKLTGVKVYFSDKILAVEGTLYEIKRCFKIESEGNFHEVIKILKSIW